MASGYQIFTHMPMTGRFRRALVSIFLTLLVAERCRECHSRGMTGKLLCRLHIHRWRVQRNADKAFRECSRCGKLWEEINAMKYRPMSEGCSGSGTLSVNLG